MDDMEIVHTNQHSFGDYLHTHMLRHEQYYYIMMMTIFLG